MTPEAFIDNVIDSISSLVAKYSQGSSGPTHLGAELDKLQLTGKQRERVLALIKLAVEESTHSLISGIEGVSALGHSRERYRLLDESGVEITGELEALLYKKLEPSG